MCACQNGSRILTTDIFRHEPDMRPFLIGETIFNEGDCMYAVLEGEVEIRRDGRILDRVGAGGVFGEMALIDDSRGARPRSPAARVNSPH